MTFVKGNKYSFQKCWQLWFSERTIIIIFRNVSYPFFWTAGDKCKQVFSFRKWLRLLEIIIFWNVSNYNFQKWWRQMLAILISQECRWLMLAVIMFRNAGDKYYLLENPEMLARNVSNYVFQKCWRYMSAILILRNAGNNNYNYIFGRAS